MKITRKTQTVYTATGYVEPTYKDMGFVHVIIVNVHYGIFMYSFNVRINNKLIFYFL